MALAVGSRLGHYDVTALIGEGGMGQVYRATDTQLGRDVALKILPDAFAGDPDRLARFQREAQVLASLNHANIAQIYGTEEDKVDGTRALVLELVEGPTLADRIAQGAMPIEDALPIARQIAEALEAAHEAAVIHRDLKPANIKVREDGTVKVLDFGLAKALDTTAEGDPSQSPTLTAAATQMGVILGTAAYMSPEQARGRLLDKWSDVWAFGCVLYEMLTGSRVFPGETVSDTIAAVLEREPDWRTLPDDIPDRVRVLLRRCLERDAKRRLRDVGDARLELDDPAAAVPTPTATSVESVDGIRARPRSRWMLAAALMALAGVLLVGSVWYVNAPDDGWRNPLADAQFTPLTEFDGVEESVAISRDGQFVAFLSDQTGVFDAWIGQIGTGQFNNLTEGRTPGQWNRRTRNISFTPDGAGVLVWVRNDAGVVGQWTVPTLGGPVRPFLDGVAELDWSPDGTRFAYHPAGPGDPIYVTERDEQVGTLVFTADTGRHNHFPIWSPDGRYIYFVHGVAQLQESDVWRIPPAGGERERITFHSSAVSYPVLLDERTLLYLATAEDGSGPWLYAVDVEQRVPRRVSVGVERYTALDASEDGRRIVATVSRSSATLWRVPIGVETAGESRARRIEEPTVRGVSPRFGQDALVYRSSRSGTDGLGKVADGAVIELWSGLDGRVVAGPAIEPDSGRIAFTIQRSEQTRLYVMNEDGTGVRPLAEALDVRGMPAWSPDGRWITVAADVGSGPRLFAVPPDKGAPMCWSTSTRPIRRGRQTVRFSCMRARRRARRFP